MTLVGAETEEEEEASRVVYTDDTLMCICIWQTN